MNRIFLLGIILSVTGCATHDPRPFSGVDPALISYVRYWEDRADWNGGGVRAGYGFGITKGTSIGYCHYRSSYGKTYWWVTIKKSWWDTAEESTRLSLVGHEFGHCELSRGHKDSDSEFSDGCPDSLMRASVVSSRCFDAHEDYYVDELFGRL